METEIRFLGCVRMNGKYWFANFRVGNDIGVCAYPEAIAFAFKVIAIPEEAFREMSSNVIARFPPRLVFSRSTLETIKTLLLDNENKLIHVDDPEEWDREKRFAIPAEFLQEMSYLVIAREN